MSALDRMIARVTGYAVVEGSILYDTFSPVAQEIDEMTNTLLPAALDAVMPDTALGDDLDRVAYVYGVERKPGSKATGQVSFTGTEGATIAQGTPVTTATGLVFVTTAAASVPAEGNVLVAVEAAADGSEYNVGAGTITQMPLPLVGITTVTNPAATGGGATIETDEALRVRLLLRIRLPSASGTTVDYERWALEVQGVEAAQCVPIWNGPGTVKIIIAGEGMTIPDETIRQRCADYIETVRPVGVAVTVTAATAKAVTVAADITLAIGYTIPTVQASVETAITDYLRSLGMGADSVSMARAGAALLSVPGVTDYSGLTINGVAANLALADEELPSLSEVTLS